MHAITKTPPKSWLAFELNVLRRLKFTSVAMPFCPNPALGSYLKRWDVRIAANDPLEISYARNVAQILNPGDGLTANEVDMVLDDAYVPGYRIENAALTHWFSETDAWWFSNVRRNIERLQTPISKAIASSLALSTGQYALPFTDATRKFRLPLSTTFRRLWSIYQPPSHNGRNNTVSKKVADEFVAESFADLLFLRLPPAHANSFRANLGNAAWGEEWLRGNGDFWHRLETSHTLRLGATTSTKSQYLRLVDEMLRRSGHIKAWAIAHVEAGSISTQELVDTISKIRRVDTIYTKDFSELTGTKAVIITA